MLTNIINNNGGKIYNNNKISLFDNHIFTNYGEITNVGNVNGYDFRIFYRSKLNNKSGGSDV